MFSGGIETEQWHETDKFKKQLLIIDTFYIFITVVLSFLKKLTFLTP